MELGGDLPHGESLIVVKLQHLLLSLRQHLLAGKAQIPPQSAQKIIMQAAGQSHQGSQQKAAGPSAWTCTTS